MQWTVLMLLFDVNIFICAHRPESPNHSQLKAWVENAVSAEEPFAASELVLAAFVRVVSNIRIFKTPTPADHAIRLAESYRALTNCVIVSPGNRHWSIFVDLINSAGAKGNLITDAYFAALAIEHGAEWITTDRDFARFPGLRWRHPLT
jgi:uncharacterized protein